MSNFPKPFSSVTPDAFGSRFLTDKDRVFEHNAWDQVEWDPDFLASAQETIQQHLEVAEQHPSVSERRIQFEDHGADFWDKFYQKHENRFFKDRHWLSIEFPELFSALSLSQSRIWEIGCGVGNTLFPLLQYVKYGDMKHSLTQADQDANDKVALKTPPLEEGISLPPSPDPSRVLSHTPQNTTVTLIGSDFSSTAIQVLRSHPLYDSERMISFVYDLTDSNFPPLKENSIDVILAIFVLSAINPVHLPLIFRRFYSLLKPGGYILFRDYGRYDLAQMRFSHQRIIGPNYYARGDGTRVYFFTCDEIQSLAQQAGFTIEQNTEDRRLLVNRRRHLQMYRVWIQSKLRKAHE